MKCEHSNKRFWLKFISVILLVIFTISCDKKQDDLIIQGTVKSINEDISLEGVSIELYTRKVESGIFSANYVLFGSAMTSHLGEFSFAFCNAFFISALFMFASYIK